MSKLPSERRRNVIFTRTDFGVTDTEIVLGALTDSSGPFKVGGVLVTHGNEIWAEEVNAD